MALLLDIDYKMNNILCAHLTFDDKTEKHVVFEIDNVYTVTYAHQGTLATITGSLRKIITPYEVRDPLNVKLKQYVLEFDCSTDCSANVVRMNAGDVRDVVVEDPKTNQAGMTYVLDTMTGEKSYANITTKYDTVTEIDMQFNVNSKTLDPDIIDPLLSEPLVEGMGWNGVIGADLCLDVNESQYKDATHYSVNFAWGKDAFVEAGYTLQPVVDGKAPTKVFMMTTYYRPTEDAAWIHGSQLPLKSDTILTPKDQLAAVTGVPVDRILREYGYLYRFEPAISGTVLTVRYDFYKDNMTVGTEYVSLVYTNKVKPENIIINVDEFQLEIGDTKQLTGRVLPSNVPVPDIHYFSSNPEVASVGTVDGIITAIAEGTTIITAIAADNAAITKEFYVNVVPNSKPNFTITAADATTKIGKGDTVVPVAYSDAVVPDSLAAVPATAGLVDVVVTDVNTLTLTPVAEGTTTIELKALKSGYNPAVKIINVTVLPETVIIETETEEDLKNAISDENVDIVNISAPTTAFAEPVVLNHPMIINGNGNVISMADGENAIQILPEATGSKIENVVIDMAAPVMAKARTRALTQPNDPCVWTGCYGIQIYKSEATFKDVKITNANAAILVNGSKVTLEGTVDVSGNGFGGIEVSKGVNVTEDPVLTIAEGATIVNTTEDIRKPTIWEDDVTGCVVGADAMSTTPVVKPDGSNQVFYFNGDHTQYVAEVATNDDFVAMLNYATNIKLVDNFTLEKTVTIPAGRTVNIDLNGKTISYQMIADGITGSAPMITVSAGAIVTLDDTVGTGVVNALGFDVVNNGWADSTKYTTKSVIECFGKFTMNNGTIKIGKYCAWTLGITGTECDMVLNRGNIDATWKAEYEGGADGGCGIAINGTKKYEGAKLTINEGFVINSTDTSIYLPSVTNTTINGATISSDIAAAVEIRSGNLTMTGGNLSSNAARKTDVSANGGATGAYTGALVAVKPKGVSATGYNGHININITGGTLNNSVGDAICVVHEKPTKYTEPQNVIVSVVASAINGGQNIQDGFGSIEGDSYTVA